MFVIASDDVDWCRKSFGHLDDVVFPADAQVEVGQPTFDLAVLSLCDHSIIR